MYNILLRNRLNVILNDYYNLNLSVEVRKLNKLRKISATAESPAISYRRETGHAPTVYHAKKICHATKIYVTPKQKPQQ